jgi:hypothetical protein
MNRIAKLHIKNKNALPKLNKNMKIDMSTVKNRLPSNQKI